MKFLNLVDVNGGSYKVNGIEVIDTNGKVDFNLLKNLPTSYTPAVHTHPYTDVNNVPTNTILGRITAATGATEALTPAQVRTLINVADGANNYTQPAYTGKTINLDTSGAQVIDVLTLTSDSTGHVTAASVTTRNLNLSDLYDTTITTPANNNVLQYDSTSGKWLNRTLAQAGIQPAGSYAAAVHTHTVSNITDAGTAAQRNVGIAVGNVPEIQSDGKLSSSILPASAVTSVNGYAGAVNLTYTDVGAASSGHSHYMTDILDTSISSLTNGQILKWNGTKWINTTIATSDIADATTAQKGVVQLNTAINSTSTTQAATPSAVKSAYDLAATKADANHNHDTVYLKLTGGTLTGPITTPNNSMSIKFGDDAQIGDVNVTNMLGIQGQQDATTGGFVFGSALDTNLYRSAANTLKTDDNFIALSLSTGTISSVGTITGAYGTIVRSIDEWLRFNDTGDIHTNGVYFGSSIVRTDGEFQLGNAGASFRATSGGAVTASASVTAPAISGTTSVTAPTVTASTVVSTPAIDVKSTSNSSKFTIEFNETENSLDFVFA